MTIVPKTLPPPPETEIDRAMDEADPVKALTRSGGLRLIKRTSQVARPPTEPLLAQAEVAPKPPASVPSVPVGEASVAPPSDPVAVISSLAATGHPEETSREAVQAPPAPAAPVPAAVPQERTVFDEEITPDEESPFILPPAAPAQVQEAAASVSPPTLASRLTAGATSLRRKAKLSDVARRVAPSQPDEPESVPVRDKADTVIPPAFPVAVATGSLTQPEPPLVEAAPPVTEKQPLQEPGTIPLEHLSPQGGAKDKKEFLLTNGERILGHILSENAEAIYLDHDTLGVLTLPRDQIAQHPVEIILINGDRIVGDIMAETPDIIYIRHASLGILTVPRAQRSTRVVEAILKDGDRILGEVLAETENFTVIRSASLGTIAVPHNKVALLNRKIEQVELRALPPALEDKPKG